MPFQFLGNAFMMGGEGLSGIGGRPLPVAGAALDMDFARNVYVGATLANLTTVRASPGMAQRLDGSFVDFAANAPRITDKGLLVEEVRTNLFLNSAAPVTQTITVASGTAYTVSVYGSGSLTLSGAGSGTATQGAPVTFTASTTSLTVTTAGLTGSFVNVNVEAGAFATSPIRTTAAAATRAMDVVTLTPVPGLNQAAGTLYAEGGSFDTVTGSPCLASLDDATTNERIQVRRLLAGNLNTIVVDGGVVQASMNSVPVTMPLGVPAKNALAYALNDINAASAGFLGVADTAATLPTVTRMHMANGIGAAPLNGYLQRVAYYPTRLPNADLQALTA